MFTLRLIVSFFVGGLFIALQTLIAERVPLRWRGVALTVPSTSAISFLFIGLTKTAADVPAAARSFPAALAPCYLFILIFAALSGYSLSLAIIAGYMAWGLGAYLIITHPPATFALSAFVYALPFIFLTYYFVLKLPEHSTLTPVPFNAKHLFVRSLVGGTVVATVVLLSKVLGNVWGGVFSAFPAAFSTTLLIYYFVHGKKIIPSVAKTMFFPGAFVFILFAWVVSLMFPRYGIWWGTVLAYAAVALFYWLRQFMPKKA